MKVKCLLIGVVVLFVVGLLTTSSYAKVDPKTCVGMWLFDEGSGTIATDSSGNKNNGTLTNGPKWVDGKFGKALEFDGVDDYVKVPDSDTFDLKDFTLTAWIKTSSTNRIISQQVSPNFWVLGVRSGGKLQAALSYECAGWCPVLGNTSVNDNAWRFVTLVREAGNTIRYYVDGKADGSFPSSSSSTYTISNFVCINSYSGASEFLNSLIDEVAIFNVALAVGDIQAIMNKGLKESFSGLSVVDLSDKLTTTWADIKAQ